MRILIATGIFPPDVGGPAIYAKNLADEFAGRGYEVKVLAYRLERKLPIGIRHFFYFLRVVLNMWKTDLIIALDIFSVGLPAVLAGKIFSKKTILRVGGDFLWETYVEATGDLIKLTDFYKKQPAFPLKFKIISFLQKFVLKNASALAFNTNWQKDFFQKYYNLDAKKTFVVENFYPVKNKISDGTGGEKLNEKVFIWIGRKVKLKNLEILERAFAKAKKTRLDIELEISENIPHEELIEKMEKSYAVILPSISDVAPNFVIEAIGLNKPFILTKETGLFGKLKDIGIFIDPFDEEDIKEKILFLSENGNYKEYQKKVSGFNFTHSWREIADEFLKI